MSNKKLEVGTKIKQTIDTSVSDREWVAQFENDLKMLCGVVIEMVEENPRSLLSPAMRQLLVRQAKLVDAKRMRILGKIVIDNPLENLEYPTTEQHDI